MEDCIISQFNHPVQDDYSKSSKFENSCLAFFKCLRGSKCDMGKLNCKEHKRYQKDKQYTSKQRDKVFADSIKKNLL